MHADPTACCGVYVGGVSVAAATTLTLGSRFARELPELAVAWQANDLEDARLLVLNEPLATELGLEPAFLRGAEGLRFLTGNLVPAGAEPVAQAYAGHQFGGFAPRSATAGRCCSARSIDAHGRRARHRISRAPGRTPFARGGDGKAAVGPMLREYMSARPCTRSGIPTTRALAVAATGEQVHRERVLPGAVLTRVAASHLASGLSVRAPRRATWKLCARLADYADRAARPRRSPRRQPYLALLRRGHRRAQASLDRAVDARRVHPRRDEHRQHDDLGRDDRLRAVRVHGRLRPRRGVQLDRPRRPLRLRQPAR